MGGRSSRECAPPPSLAQYLSWESPSELLEERGGLPLLLGVPLRRGPATGNLTSGSGAARALPFPGRCPPPPTPPSRGRSCMGRRFLRGLPLLLARPLVCVRHRLFSLESDQPPKRPRSNLMAPPRIGTHNGTFHCDEALACALLRLLPEYRVRSA